MAIITNSNAYTTKSGLYLKYGPYKTAISPWGDYVMFGPNRIIEGTVDLTQVTAGNTLIVSDVLFFPSLPAGQLFIEQVEAIVETATAGGTSVSLGLIDSDRSTVPGGYGTAFINADANLGGTVAAGTKIVYTKATTGAGGLIGSSAAVQTPIAPDIVNGFYITCTAAGTYTAGKIRFRIMYHALDAAITQ
jgi:hypothetical protein